ncbi:relaxase/mobilization nuclease domain-containing protein [Photobacterium sagamiensis]|uniref:hypothetical protein n=1 Tax=Photobacterium sagamiensis TaxID=2910241 RepID=UPI003D11FE1B
MTAIAIFKTDGAHTSKPTAVTDYIHGKYSALTDTQKELLKQNETLLRLARESGDVQLEAEATYLLGQIHGKIRNPPPQPITDNRAQVEYAIAITPHVHKYTSGVIAHAEEDTEKILAKPAIEPEFRELLEALFFAGLPEEDRLIEWVRHTHEKFIENHFVVPRIHLRTGKYFNPTPPGCEGDLNAVRNYLNFKYDLASPDDPERSRLTQGPRIYEKNRDLKKVLNQLVVDLINKRRINNRDDVVNLLKQQDVQKAYGFYNVEISSNFIRIYPTNKLKAVRLRGKIFSGAFQSIESLAGEKIIQSRDERLTELKEELEHRIRKRAAFNIRRYLTVNAGINQTKPTPENEGQSQQLEPTELSKQASISKGSLFSATSRNPLPEQITVSYSDLVLGDLDPALTGWQLVEELERRRVVAAMIAEEAARKKQAALLKVFQKLHHYLIINNKGTEYELFGATIAELYTNYAEREPSTNQRVNATTARTIEVLRNQYETVDAGVSEGKTNPASQADRDPQLYNRRVQQLAAITSAARNRIGYTLWLSRVIVDEINQPSNVIGTITTRCRASTDGINRIIVQLAESSKLLSQFKNEIARRLIASKRLKQQTLTVEMLVNHINGDKVSVISKTDPNKQ